MLHFFPSTLRRARGEASQVSSVLAALCPPRLLASVFLSLQGRGAAVPPPGDRGTAPCPHGLGEQPGGAAGAGRICGRHGGGSAGKPWCVGVQRQGASGKRISKGWEREALPAGSLRFNNNNTL